MKKFLILILSCCFALILCACADKGGNGNGGDKEYYTGAVFQVRNLSDLNTENKSFADKVQLKSYITDNFSDDCYFCVFEEDGTSEIFDNIGAESTVLKNSVNFYLSSDECLIIYYISYNSASD
ncbi:MAG: hypothetical protein K2N50_00605 [Clostridia bacterium]|nr:hypothetical protein [Clostridia bacterium]